jgi:TolB protein
MKPDGSERRALFNAPQCDSFLTAWSPDSSRVLVNAMGSIYSVRLSDATALQLTPDNNTQYSYNPVWSPDGSKIAYVFDQHESSENYDLYLMNADGGSQKRLTENPAADIGPCFTADGKALLFSSGDDKSNELYLYNLETNAIEQLTDSKTHKFSWTLSPDSSQVIYTEHVATNNDKIYLLDVQSKTAQALGETVFAEVGHYSWRPTGSGA